MDYELKAKTAYLNRTLTPQDRVQKCEREIAEILEKYGCVMIVQVAAK